jgi:hypothetical protein
MSVKFSPISGRSFFVGAASDPYKKYWWAILAGFICTGAWLCSPLLGQSVGSGRVDTAKKVDAAGAEQSLDSANNPDGAPGGALDLSMGGAKRKSGAGDDDMISMLYQPPPEAGAATAGKTETAASLDAATAASVASLAQQLKDIGRKAASGSEKAKGGSAAAQLAGGLSDSGSSGGGSHASASVSAGSGGLFGSHDASVGSGAARGLQEGGVVESEGFKALKASAAAASAPNLKSSNEAVHAGMSQSFDGSKGKTSAPSGSGAMAQARVALDAVPADLKTKDNSQLNLNKLPDPPAAASSPASSDSSGSSGSDMVKQMAEMGATMAVGGMVGGMGGQMVMMVGMRMIMQQQQQAAAAASQQQSTVNNRYGVTSS